MKHSKLEEIRSRWANNSPSLPKTQEEANALILQAFVDAQALSRELEEWIALVNQIEQVFAVPAQLNLERTARIKDMVAQFRDVRRG